MSEIFFKQALVEVDRYVDEKTVPPVAIGVFYPSVKYHLEGTEVEASAVLHFDLYALCGCAQKEAQKEILEALVTMPRATDAQIYNVLQGGGLQYELPGKLRSLLELQRSAILWKERKNPCDYI
ncbi:hypothetical protein QR680_007694 [Steinernema hermaphroditum]|uniref:Uncharacterized protein n=1 Tax=Steinernema hermaphroditum TaxID=289476 RepID=A0AA39M6J1_9BILA|nr:hypothetical protein QR680_007694 [Steinernema hermaphroditum]